MCKFVAAIWWLKDAPLYPQWLCVPITLYGCNAVMSLIHMAAVRSGYHTHIYVSFIGNVFFVFRKHSFMERWGNC